MTIQNTFNDFLIRIKNTQKTKKTYCIVPTTNLIIGTLNLLYEEGFINGFYKDKKYVKIFLKYKTSGEPTIQTILMISKPGIPKYISIQRLKTLEKKNKNLGLMILTTSQGILSPKKAIQKNIGGQLLYQIF